MSTTNPLITAILIQASHNLMTNMWSQSIILKEILGLVSRGTSSLKSGISFIINFVHCSFHPMWTVLPWCTVCEDSSNVQVSLAPTGTTGHEDHNHPNDEPAHFANEDTNNHQKSAYPHCICTKWIRHPSNVTGLWCTRSSMHSSTVMEFMLRILGYVEQLPISHIPCAYH
jgi:hypothetical protein